LNETLLNHIRENRFSQYNLLEEHVQPAPWNGPIDYQGRASQVRLEDFHVPTLSSSIQKLYIYFLISHNVSICSKLTCIQHHQTAVLTQVKNCVELPSHSEPTKDTCFNSQTKVWSVTLVMSSLMVYLEQGGIHSCHCLQNPLIDHILDLTLR